MGVRLLICGLFSVATCLFFPLAMYKKIKLSVILRVATLIQGAMFNYFLPNVPGAMFIQGATSIPDSRVSR